MASTSHNEFVTSTGVLWDDPEEGKTWLVSLVGVVILAALVVMISVIYFRQEHHEYDVKVVDAAYVSLQQHKTAQLELLTQSGPYDVTAGDKTVQRRRQPIGQAMEALAANPRLAIPRPAAGR